MDYTDAVITYIDVLGFKEIIERYDAAAVDAVLSQFAKHAAPYFMAESSGQSYVAFSDLIVRLSPLEDPRDLDELSDRLTTEMSDVAAAQSQLCQQRIVVRGAITVGKIASHSTRLFGPGLVRAHELEKSVARYPRVIIDPELVERLKLSPWLDDPTADGNDFEPYVMEPCQYCVRDRDGQVFVDYLGSICELGNDGTAEAMAEEHVLLAKHQRTVEHGLRSTNARIREKYFWLREYHNRHAPPGTSTFIPTPERTADIY